MAQRCYLLWTQTHSGNVTFEPVVFTSAAAAITEGERLKERRTIKDYNYSVIDAPHIGDNNPPKKVAMTGLTLANHQPTIQL